MNTEIKKQNETDKSENEQKQKPSVETLRTFKSDISSYLQKQKVSWEDLIKKKKAQELGGKIPLAGLSFERMRKNSVFLAIFSVLILFVLSIVFLFFRPSPQAPVLKIFRPPKTLIPANELIEIKALDRKKFFDEWRELQRKKLAYRDFRSVYLAKEKNDVKTALGPGEVFDFLEIPLPPSLKESLGSDMTFGFLKTDVAAENEPVFIVAVQNFSRAFAAMLKWEPSMARDFRFFIEENKISATDAALFSDIVVKNQNSRILYVKENLPVMGYGFFNKKILIIGFSEKALEIMFEKLMR